MSSDARLMHLATLAGIEPGYWDIAGAWHDLSPETARALLAAMAIDAADAAAVEHSIVDLETRPWRRALPPVIVGEEQQPIPLTCHLPAHFDIKNISWSIALENGETITGVLDGATLVTEARHDEMGVARYRLDLRADLPLGYHTLQLDLPQTTPLPLIIAPAACYLPAEAEAGARRWGIAAHLYAVRGAHDAGIGDFTDLTQLIEQAAAAGAATVGLNPLHALFLGSPEDASPYAPSSRLFLNPLYLDVGAPAPPHAAHIDYAAVARAKRSYFERDFAHFRPTADFERFCRERGAALQGFAAFEALSEHFGSHLWTTWPGDYRDCASAAVAEFCVRHRQRLDFHIYLQWRCHQQMMAAAARANQRLPLGLYGDLALSVSAHGADAWLGRELYTAAVELGAPADDFNPKGQTWGVVSPRPQALYDDAYASFIALMRANMRYVRVLRLDHVMGLARLFWVPAGMSANHGAYVRYPADDLLRIVALESQRQGCVIIGEDLGTVTPDFRRRLAEKKILSYRVLYFEKSDHRFRRPEEYPALAMACLSTHDLPTLKGYWQGADLALKRALHLFASEHLSALAEAQRMADKTALIAALQSAGLLPDDVDGRELSPALALALHCFVARAAAWLMMVQIDDLAGETEQINLPGTAFEHANWRRRLAVDLDTLFGDAWVREVLAAVAAERAAVTPRPLPATA
ncbi:MAG: 4-alpha-glucanotransferase [Sphingomonadales bacterium]|nr:4-alpha-glucanotransferase [Sphingomonadales bacterium]